MSTRFGDLKGDLLAMVGALEREGTASGGTGTTLVDAGVLVDADDTFKNFRVYVHDGVDQGDEKLITASSSSGASVTAAFAATPDNTSKYYIYSTYKNVTIERAFKIALRFLRRRTLLPKVDESLTLGDPTLAASYELTVPTGFAAIRSIWREDTSLAGLFTLHVPGPGDSDCPWWYPVRSATRKIRLDKAIADHHGWIESGKKLRIVGQAFETEPTTDDSTLDINTGPLLTLAAALLRLQTLNSVEQIGPTRDALVKAIERLELGRGFEQGTVIIEEM
jgi:hypothetical protein